MKRNISVILLTSVLWGCSHTAHLYPVQGRLSEQNPPPVVVAKITGALSPGDFSAVLNNGEVCKGHFQEVARAKTTTVSNPATGPASSEMSSAWDAIYGPGFYVAHVLGARLYARAKAQGNRGTTLQVEIYRPEDVKGENLAAAIKGVARDSDGNVYKIVF
jgi:hypothetical protein